MTHLAKFIRSSLTLARRAIGTISNNGGWMNENRPRCCFRSECKRGQASSLLSSSHCYGDYEHSSGSSSRKETILLLGASYALLGLFDTNEEEKEDPLITTVKRCILLIQKEEFTKAEQMLHLALHDAQLEHNESGITYIYDVMANLAFHIGELDKAEKLFKAVMSRLLLTGTAQDDLGIVHMSLKVAAIRDQKGDNENAEIGYQYCLKILQKHIDEETESNDIIALWARNLDLYGQLLSKMSRYSEAMELMEKAHKYCVKLNGEIHQDSILFLNNLGQLSFMKGNLDDSVSYLNKAIESGEKLPNMEYLSSIYVNLGNVYIVKGLLDEALRSCANGLTLAKKEKNVEAMGEAQVCLDEVNKLLIK